MITPMDLHNREFKVGFRGYEKDDVDAFMSQLANDYEVVFRDNREMKEVIEQLRDKLAQYEQMEQTMNNTLVLAQETAENVKAAARKEAELIVQSAEQQKAHMIQNTAKSIRDGQARYEVIRNDVAVFRAKMESLLKSQLQLLDGIELPEYVEDAPVEGPQNETEVVDTVVVEETPAVTADVVVEGKE